MFGRTHIEPVPPDQRSAAARFLVAGATPVGSLQRPAPADAAGGEALESRVSGMEAMIDSRRPEDIRFWQARRWSRRVAAAMIVQNPGRTGFLFFSPPTAPGVDAAALTDLIRALSQEAIRQGLTLTQSLVSPDLHGEIEVLRSAGYELLADLIYMRLDLAREVPDEARCDLTWRSYGEFSEAELAEVIVATYKGSLDCPRLSGVRLPQDVIQGHKASGIFCPPSWWLVCRDGQPAGCILVNGCSTAGAAEVVYMGVVPACRGQGVSRAMLRHAVRFAREHQLVALTLAVDARNTYAMRVYQEEGFRPTDRRLAYAMIKG
jgi:ribosomal protein S18 acetylase RimI-like enzyme